MDGMQKINQQWGIRKTTTWDIEHIHRRRRSIDGTKDRDVGPGLAEVPIDMQGHDERVQPKEIISLRVGKSDQISRTKWNKRDWVNLRAK